MLLSRMLVRVPSLGFNVGSNIKGSARLRLGYRKSFSGNADIVATPSSRRPDLFTRVPLRARAAASARDKIDGAVLTTRVLTKYTQQWLKEMDKQMNYRGYHTLRWTVAIITGSTLTLYAFRDEITEWFGHTGADITSRTLGDESVQREARELARGFVYELLNDRKALALTTEFLNMLLSRDYTREAVVDLLGNVAQQEQTQVLLADLFKRVLSDPAFINNAAVFVQDLCERETTKTALINLFAAVFSDPQGQKVTADFFSHVMATETFRQAAADVASDAAEQCLRNDELKHQAVKWARDVLGEPDLHSQAGDAIWGALTSTFIPGFLRGGKPSPGPVGGGLQVQNPAAASKEVGLEHFESDVAGGQAVRAARNPESTATAAGDTEGHSVKITESADVEADEEVVFDEAKDVLNIDAEICDDDTKLNKGNPDEEDGEGRTEEVTEEGTEMESAEDQAIETFQDIQGCTPAAAAS